MQPTLTSDRSSSAENAASVAAHPATQAEGGTRPGRQIFTGIELGRGVAAALVVLHHAGNIVAQPRFFGHEAFGSHLERFHVGVDFFFVLSGFIICWMHFDDLGRRNRLGNYAQKRFLRIYPPYWGILLPLIVLYQLFPAAGIPSQRDAANVVMSTLLLPYPLPPVLGVAWTLVHEIFFYAIFGAIIVAGRAALWLLPLWTIGIVAAQAIGDLPFALSFVLSPYNLQFVMGVAVALLLRRWRVPAPPWLFCAGIAVFMTAMLLPTPMSTHPFWGRIVFGAASAAILAAIVEHERKRPLVLPPMLRLFGRASYAVYLVHPVALSLAVHGASRLRPDVPLEVVVVALASVAILAGIAYHVAVEGRLVTLFRHLLRAASPRGMS